LVGVLALCIAIWMIKWSLPIKFIESSSITFASDISRDDGQINHSLWGAVRKNIISDRFSTKTAISAQR